MLPAKPLPAPPPVAGPASPVRPPDAPPAPLASQEVLAALGARLRDRRTRAGLSQGALGHAAGVTGAYVGMLERGLRNPGFLTVAMLAEAMGIAVGELMP